MSISRWKLMAGFLGLSVGGLAVCSGQSTTPPRLPVPMVVALPDPGVITLPPPPVGLDEKPVLPATAPETLPPPVKPETVKDIEFLLPLTAQSLDLVPVKAEEKKPQSKPVSPEKLADQKNPAVVEVYDPIAPPPVALPGTGEKPTPLAPSPSPLQFAPSYPTRSPLQNTTPPLYEVTGSVTLPTPPTPPKEFVSDPVPVKKEVAEPLPLPKGTPKVEATQAKLKMLLRIGSGTPRFEIRNTSNDELLLKVYGEKIEMQAAPEGGKGSPLAGVTASGKVKFTGPGVEGTCDQLTLMSGTGEVLMKGNVQMKTKRGRSWSELTAEKMIYQIGVTGLSSTGAKTTSSSTPITPVVFRE